MCQVWRQRTRHEKPCWKYLIHTEDWVKSCWTPTSLGMKTCLRKRCQELNFTREKQKMAHFKCQLRWLSWETGMGWVLSVSVRLLTEMFFEHLLAIWMARTPKMWVQYQSVGCCSGWTGETERKKGITVHSHSFSPSLFLSPLCTWLFAEPLDIQMFLTLWSRLKPWGSFVEPS